MPLKSADYKNFSKSLYKGIPPDILYFLYFAFRRGLPDAGNQENEVDREKMKSNFSRVLSLLRQEKGVSQRLAAGELGISQALLSHYENGIREPGLNFVARACDYYHVSADYLLGRTDNPEVNR